jgi:hypothetical protein
MDRQKRFQEGIERYRNAIADYPEDAIPFRIEQKRGDSPRVSSSTFGRGRESIGRWLLARTDVPDVGSLPNDGTGLPVGSGPDTLPTRSPLAGKGPPT